MKRCSLHFVALITLLVFNAFSFAAVTTAPFDEKTFSDLQEKNAFVLIDVKAKWCPTCKKQGQILEEYQAQRPNVDLHILLVDFDTQKEWVKKLRAPRQSTLILFSGKEKIWFSVAEKRKEKIFYILDQMLMK